MLFSGPAIGEVTLSGTNDHLVLRESSLWLQMSIHDCLDIIRRVSLSSISLLVKIIFLMIVYDNPHFVAFTWCKMSSMKIGDMQRLTLTSFKSQHNVITFLTRALLPLTTLTLPLLLLGWKLLNCFCCTGATSGISLKADSWVLEVTGGGSSSPLKFKCYHIVQ